MTVLVLGGTAEARALAAALVAAGQPVLSSLAGRVSQPLLPVGHVRVGGFGGVRGLVEFLAQQPVSQVVDATHPFAAQISANATAACAATGRPLLRLTRPGWADHPDAPRWRWVPDAHRARAAITGAERPFLTSGRSTLSAFLPLADRDVLVRLVDPPEEPLPVRWRVLLSRGPYELAEERRLLRDHAVDALVTKDSGGAYTVAKLDAAAELGVTVVVIQRPPPPPDVATVTDVAAALAWCLRPVS